MALKVAHTLAGNLTVPEAYFRISGYRVDLVNRTVTASIEMFASPETRKAYKAAAARLEQLPAERTAAAQAHDLIAPAKVREKSDAKLQVMRLDNEQVNVEADLQKNRPALDLEWRLDRDRADTLIAGDGSVKLADLYAALKTVELEGAEDL